MIARRSKSRVSWYPANAAETTHITSTKIPSKGLWPRPVSFHSTYNTRSTTLLHRATPQAPTSQQQNRKRRYYASSHTPSPDIATTEPETQVLCVNTEPCANAGGEVRGDLHHGVPVASALSPQAYEGLPEVVVEVVGGGGVGD